MIIKIWGNQIYLVTFMCLTVDTSFILTKNQIFQNVYLISLERARCCQKLDIILFSKWVRFWSYQKKQLTKSVILDILLWKIRTFLTQKIVCDFWRHCAISVLQISKNHFETYNLRVKLKLETHKHH